MKAAKYTKTGTKSSDVELDKKVFGVTSESTTLLAQAYEASSINSRTINAYTKTRGEVRGGGRKPWKQKGTGRARAGTIRSPLWKGGSVTFGPTGDGKSVKISKKSKQSALKQALTLAAKSGSIKVIEDFEAKDSKTKEAAKLLSAVDVKGSTIIVTDEFNQSVEQATSNIPRVDQVDAMKLHVNDVLDNDTLLITKKGLEKLSERLGK